MHLVDHMVHAYFINIPIRNKSLRISLISSTSATKWAFQDFVFIHSAIYLPSPLPQTTKLMHLPPPHTPVLQKEKTITTTMTTTTVNKQKHTGPDSFKLIHPNFTGNIPDAHSPILKHISILILLQFTHIFVSVDVLSVLQNAIELSGV